MSYTLGSITLPTPNSFRREYIETAKVINTLNGTLKKDITNRKERFVLGFRMLTQAEISSILTEYDLQTTRTFTVSETNLTIAATTVHIDIESREYGTKGTDYLEDFFLILTEVQ